MYRYLFGPVPSRRLGSSFGVDLVSAKTCSFDCVFCQVGRTGVLTIDRKEYVPVSAVVAELQDWIGHGGKADFITLAGAGEPTLNVGFGHVIDAIHHLSKIKTAILSNGSLFYMPEVRLDACMSDLVKVSLGAWDQDSFEKLNQPIAGLKFSSVLEGLRVFGKEFKGVLWLEIFVVAGINDQKESMQRIADLAFEIGPDHIHLNTVVRPPADHSARAVSLKVLEQFASLFSPVAEVIPSFSTRDPSMTDGGKKNIAGLLARHPCRIEDVAMLFGGDCAKAKVLLSEMLSQGDVRLEMHGEQSFYTGVDPDGCKNRT